MTECNTKRHPWQVSCNRISAPCHRHGQNLPKNPSPTCPKKGTDCFRRHIPEDAPLSYNSPRHPAPTHKEFGIYPHSCLAGMHRGNLFRRRHPAIGQKVQISRSYIMGKLAHLCIGCFNRDSVAATEPDGHTRCNMMPDFASDKHRSIPDSSIYL